MNASQLARLVMSCRPAEVPQLLVEQLPRVVDLSEELAGELLNLPDSAQRLVANTWMAALDATNGAFWAREEPIALTELGRYVLSEVALWPVHAAGTSRAPQATEHEYQLLSARLRARLDEPETDSYFAVVLGWLLCVALSCAPQGYTRIRHDLSVTALRLVTRLSQLRRAGNAEESESLMPTILALHAAAAGGLETGSAGWGRCQLSWAGELVMLFDEAGRQADLDEALYRYEQASAAFAADSIEGLACRYMFEQAMVKRHGRH